MPVVRSRPAITSGSQKCIGAIPSLSIRARVIALRIIGSLDGLIAQFPECQAVKQAVIRSVAEPAL